VYIVEYKTNMRTLKIEPIKKRKCNKMLADCRLGEHQCAFIAIKIDIDLIESVKVRLDSYKFSTVF
jgi:hypothetical protein